MFIYLLYQFNKNQDRLARKIVGFYSRVFTVLFISLKNLLALIIIFNKVIADPDPCYSYSDRKYIEMKINKQ